MNNAYACTTRTSISPEKNGIVMNANWHRGEIDVAVEGIDRQCCHKLTRPIAGVNKFMKGVTTTSTVRSSHI